ncbi:MAG TPA: peptidase S58 family protein [Chloroflexi bacterium]|nr:peptidase S58 family protein [Chloroflexota bacterium]
MANSLAGFRIGHATDAEHHTGCTVFLCPEKTVGSVDVRGPAPGSRESALLQLDKPIEYVNAVVLTGGSAFGLATADGVMRWLAERGIGHTTPVKPIPIVPAAVVYDLFLSGGHTPDGAMGYAACQNASGDDVAQGNVGAGAGVTVGKWSGPQHMMMAGFGLATMQIDDLFVGAGAVVNAVGDVVNEDSSVLAGARGEHGRWLAESDPLRRFPQRPPTQLTNTTLVVLFTNARLTKVEANRLAQRAHDGMAIAIRPSHTTHDGDTAFALASGQVEASFDLVANAGTAVVAEAIRNGARHAHSLQGIPGLAD